MKNLYENLSNEHGLTYLIYKYDHYYPNTIFHDIDVITHNLTDAIKEVKKSMIDFIEEGEFFYHDYFGICVINNSLGKEGMLKIPFNIGLNNYRFKDETNEYILKHCIDEINKTYQKFENEVN